jgi:hypothetical protein
MGLFGMCSARSLGGMVGLLTLFIMALATAASPQAINAGLRLPPIPNPYATYGPVATPVPTSVPSSGAYFIGGLVGGTIGDQITQSPVTTANVLTMLPTEPSCIKGYPGSGTGTITASPAPSAPAYESSFQGRDGADTECLALTGYAPGSSVVVTAVNGDAGGYGTVSWTVQIASQAATIAAYATPAPRTHQWFSGCIARSGTQPFGMFNSSGSLSEYKSRNLLDSGCQMVRTGPQTFVDDQSLNGGSITFTSDAPLLTYLTAHPSITPYFEMDAGNIACNSSCYSSLSIPTTGSCGTNILCIEPTPAHYASYVSAFATYLKTNYPQYGTASNPIYFSCAPANETDIVGNVDWSTTQTTNPSLFAAANYGQSYYIQPCYSAIKAAYPGALSVVAAGELSMGQESAAQSQTLTLAGWYANGCHTGNCWDEVSFHGASVGLPDQPFASCYYQGDGLSTKCNADLRAVMVANGDANARLRMSEVLIPYQSTGAFDNSSGNLGVRRSGYRISKTT